MTSTSGAAGEDGDDAWRFQLLGCIYAGYAKNCVSFQSFPLETLLKVKKSRSHGKFHKLRISRPARSDADHASPGPLKEINDDRSI
jgi:hypothetical protein